MTKFLTHISIFFLILMMLAGLYISDAGAQPTLSSYMPSSAPLISDTLTTQQELLLIDVLDSSLKSLSDKDRQGRMIGGYVLLGLGAASAVGGAVTLAAGESDDARIVGYSLLAGGPLLGGLSLVPFKVRSEAEKMYADFVRAQEDAPEQLRQKFYYWDRRFEELAEKSKRGRIIGGVTWILTGTLTALVVVDEPPEAQLHSFLWPAVGGVTSLLVKSEAERRYETYKRAKEDIARDRARASVDIGVLPFSTNGWVGTLHIRF